MPFPAEDTERLPLRRMPCDCDEDDLAMAPLPGWRAYLDLEDSEKDLLSAGLARMPLIAHNWFHMRLPVLGLSTMATPLLLAETEAWFGWGSTPAAAAAAAEVAEEASSDCREGRQEEWLAAAEASQQAIHSLQE